jgi:hypothetical protein
MGDSETACRLDAAASLLYSVGRAHPDHSDPGVRLHCLAGAHHLGAAGAVVTRSELAHAELEATIRAAMKELGALPASVFATPDVLAAADAAQIALERLEDS